MSELWEIQRAGFRMATGALRLSAKALRGAARAGQYGAENAAERRRAGRAATGVLAPGDPPPPPNIDVLDYRGLAMPGSLALATQGLPLGRLVDVRRGAQGAVALPLDAVFRHAAVIGPSGAGKTFSVMSPWIVSLLRAGFSVATVDVKGDLLDEIKGYAATMGGPVGARVLLWDYAVQRTHRWNFMQEVRSEQGLEAAVLSLLGRQKENDSQPYFYQRDYRWLKGLLRLAIEVNGDQAQPGHLIELMTDPAYVAQLLPASSARTELYDFAAIDPGDFARDISGLMNVLSVFQDPSVQRAVSTSDFTLSDAFSSPTLLVGVARLSDGRRAEQMSSLLLSQLALTTMSRFGSRPQRPVAFVIDEAPRLRQRMDLEELLSMARGARVGVCLAAQDVTQFGTEQQQSSLLANCDSYISMHGVSAASADFLAKRLGNRQREESSLTVGGKRGLFESPSRTRQVSTAPVLGSREIMFPAYGQRSALVHARSVSPAPFMVDLER